MVRFTAAAKTDEFNDVTMKKVTVRGHDILLAKIENRFYAADSLCPHLRGDLSAGKLEGTTVICPLQGSRFELKDGSVIRWQKEDPNSTALETLHPPKPIKTYHVKIEGDTILVEL